MFRVRINILVFRIEKRILLNLIICRLDREKSLDNGKNIEWFAWRAAGNTGDEDDDDDDNENKSHAPGWYYNTYR